jgi:hypothetical protein
VCTYQETILQQLNKMNPKVDGFLRTAVFGIPVIGYLYSPFKELPNYAAVVRYVALPVIALSGLWMWKGHLVRRLISKTR